MPSLVSVVTLSKEVPLRGLFDFSRTTFFDYLRAFAAPYLRTYIVDIRSGLSASIIRYYRCAFCISFAFASASASASCLPAFLHRFIQLFFMSQECELEYYPRYQRFRNLTLWFIACENCGRSNCKGKCPIRRASPPAPIASDQAKAPAFEKKWNTSNPSNTGGSGSTTSYLSSFQSNGARAPAQGKETKKRGTGSVLQLGQLPGRKKRVIQDRWQSPTGEWIITEDRGVPVPLEYLQNSFPQRYTDALDQQPPSTSTDPPRLQCPECGRTNFRDKSRLE